MGCIQSFCQLPDHYASALLLRDHIAAPNQFFASVAEVDAYPGVEPRRVLCVCMQQAACECLGGSVLQAFNSALPFCLYKNLPVRPTEAQGPFKKEQDV